MIRLESVDVVFNRGEQAERRVLQGLSLDIPKGQFVSVIGSNGAGKTTLLNAIAGTVPISAGRILVNGTDQSRSPEWKRAQYVGRVRQDPLAGTAGEMTVLDNLALAARKGRRRLKLAVPAALRRELRDKLAVLSMGLEDRLKENVNRLSGGQRQALTLLMAAVSHPAVLLLDEHTAALDPSNAELISELTRRFVQDYGLTALAVTHDMRKAIDEGDRLVMMHEGTIVADISGKAKQGLSVDRLVALFRTVRGNEYAEDRDLLR